MSLKGKCALVTGGRAYALQLATMGADVAVLYVDVRSTMDLAQFDEVLRGNLYGTAHTCTAVAPTMKEQGSGKIITVSSHAGRRASSDGGYAHYGTAKAAPPR
jgi:3-oxoacyl-[acyl-carrier protein] reductase